MTYQIVQNLPLTSKLKFRFGLVWPGQNGTFVFKSTGGFAQSDVSPCRTDAGRRKRGMDGREVERGQEGELERPGDRSKIAVPRGSSILNRF